MLPLVSIIIPTYNRAALVARAVESARRENYPRKQIIVADDGSTDDTRERLATISDIEYCQQENRGPSAARNLGLKRARGEYLAMLDADDFWHPGYLRSAIDELVQRRVDFTFNNWEIAGPGATADYDSQLHMLPYLRALDGNRSGAWIELSPTDTRKLFVSHSPAPSSGVVIRRELVRHGWNEAVQVGEDWMMLLDAILHSQSRAAFTMEKLWTKWIDGHNICDRSRQPVKRAEQEIVNQQLILSHYGFLLTRAERRGIHRKMAKTYYDWGYHESCSGNRFKAIRYFMRSFAKRPAPRPVVGAMKSLLRLRSE